MGRGLQTQLPTLVETLAGQAPVSLAELKRRLLRQFVA